ncbi:MAG: DUF4249 family protein [Bacteroidia bacterium]
MRTIILVVGMGFLSGCLKEITFKDLSRDTGAYVIEGFLTQPDSAAVKITRTTAYFAPNEFERVSHAQVYIEDQEGNVYPLSWQDSLYVARGIPVVPGRQYVLKVTAEGVTYTAVSTMPRSVKIDTAYIFWQENPTDALPDQPQSGWRIVGMGSDDPAAGDAYRVRIWRNDTLLNRTRDYIFYDDRFFNGRTIVLPLPYVFRGGEKVRAELMGIPLEALRYYQMILRNRSGSSGGFGPPTDNVPVNIHASDGRQVFGYFLTYTRSERTVILPP